MKLTRIKISGYKSIDNAEIPVKQYGKCKSYTSIFLGKNESGKSNALDAISVPIDMNLASSI